MPLLGNHPTQRLNVGHSPTPEGRTMTEKRDEVSHYTQGGTETIDYIYEKLGPEGGDAFVLGNILKYASRAQYKGCYDADIGKILNYAKILREKRAERGLHEHVHTSTPQEEYASLTDVVDRKLILETEQGTWKWWWDENTGKLTYQRAGGGSCLTAVQREGAYDKGGPFRVVGRQ